MRVREKVLECGFPTFGQGGSRWCRRRVRWVVRAAPPLLLCEEHSLPYLGGSAPVEPASPEDLDLERVREVMSS